jgi:succinoglycan biosynthesis transport protein ExoP
MKRAKETNIGVDLQSVVARVVDPAFVPLVPIKPNKRLIVAVALFMGLLVGAMLALLVDVLDNTLKTSLDVESRLKEPVLTVLPLLTAKDSDRKVSTSMVLSAPNSIYAEAVRTARTGVLLSFVDVPSRVLLITSSVPGEGKTTFASNLALAHAATKKTLLIDADMRRASISKSFGLDLAAPGLSELVAGSAPSVECLQHIEGSNLMVLTSGAIPPNPLELLHSERFADTLDTLAREFEVVIIDSPPVELVSDALVIAANVTGVIFVTKAHSTPTPLVKKGLRRLKRANGRIVGIALNALDLSKAEKYYGEYSGYGKYGYAGYKSSYGKAYGDAYGQAYGPAYGQTYGSERQTYGAERQAPPKKAD